MLHPDGKRCCDREMRDMSNGRGKPWKWKGCKRPATHTTPNGLDYCARHAKTA